MHIIKRGENGLLEAEMWTVPKTDMLSFTVLEYKVVTIRHYGPSDASTTSYPLQEHQSDTQVITVKMEILLEPTSNKLMVDPQGFEGYLKMEVKVPDSSCLKDS
ncbi:hypothetical protein Tco_1112399 [Tanacetum coccineum]|uniref:Uncharacterized protein n=1 Tax=Tanacetum coccineum TaxID=301880 RepID=A0ABQ5IQJ2_9ASTR